jgi:hypothetical protein
MRKRHPNPKRVKIHRNYTVEEVADLFPVHKNTVRTWIKTGLPVCDKRRPVLILGHELAEFLRARRTRNKQKCQPGELYCLKCRSVKVPAENMVDYTPQTDLVGNIVAIYPDCRTTMNKRVSRSKLDDLVGKIDITFPQALRHIGETAKAIKTRVKNGDLKSPFSSRDVWRPGWTGLDRESAKKGLALLLDFGHLTQETVQTGGRPATLYHTVEVEV